MKPYTYQIGTGTGNEMKTVVFSQDLLADSLGEAVDKAKAVTKARPVHANEDLVCLVDRSRAELQMVWSRSAEDIRLA